MALAAEHQKEGRLEEAERLYRRVLRAQPAQRRRAAAARADRERRGPSRTKPKRLLQKAIGIAPDFLLAILDLGQLRKEQDRYAEALECFDRAIALEPDQPQAHYLRARDAGARLVHARGHRGLPATASSCARLTSARCSASATC